MDPDRHRMHDLYHWIQKAKYKEMESRNTRARRQDRAKVQKASQADPSGPRLMSNGRLACAHICADKANCKHLCCRDGLSTPVRDRPSKRHSWAHLLVNSISYPKWQYNLIDNEISGTSTPMTEDTPSSSTISADNVLNNNTDKWLATQFPPAHFMESPVGSGRFVVLSSELRRRPEGMPTVYTSRFDAMSGGLVELWEAGMLEGQKEIDGHYRDVAAEDDNRANAGFGGEDAGQKSGLGDFQDDFINQSIFAEQDHNSDQLSFHPNSQNHEYRYELRLEQGQGQGQEQLQTLTKDFGLTWQQLLNLWNCDQLQIPRNQDQGHDQWQDQHPHQAQLPTWASDPIPGIPQYSKDTQQVAQNGGDSSPWSTFVQEEGWDKYESVFTAPQDTTTYPILDSTIQPSISLSDTTTEIQTQPPPINHNTDWFSLNPNLSIDTNPTPHTSPENPNGLDHLFSVTATAPPPNPQPHATTALFDSPKTDRPDRKGPCWWCS